MLYLRDKDGNAITVLENAFQVGYERASGTIWKLNFSLPNNDPKIPQVKKFGLVDVEDYDGEFIGTFRILPSLTKKRESENQTDYVCYHVIHTLGDSVALGEIYGEDIAPSTMLTNILDAQKTPHWVLNNVEASQPITIGWENPNGLVGPIFDILGQFNEHYAYTFDTSMYPWKLNLIYIPMEPVCRIKEGYNLVGFEMENDPSNMVNRIYPVGRDEDGYPVYIDSVTTGGVRYVQDTDLVTQFGPIEYIHQSTHWDPAKLKEEAEEILKKNKEPNIYWRVEAADLMKLANDPLLTIDKLRINRVVRVETEDFGDVDLVIRKESKQDMFGQPQQMVLELTSGELRPAYGFVDIQKRLVEQERRITTATSSVLARGRQIATELINSGFGGHVRVYPDRILIMDTDNEETTQNVWQWNHNGIGHSTTGIEGPYGLAWTIDGTFNTDFIGANTIYTRHLAADVGEAITITATNAVETKIADEVDTRITNYSSEVNQQFDNITTTFSAVTTDIDNLGNELQNALDEISTYIRFSIDGIELGEIGNPIKLFIENDRIVFTQNDVEVAYIDNNRLYITDGQFLGSLRLGAFAFLPRDNGNLSFGKVM